MRVALANLRSKIFFLVMLNIDWQTKSILFFLFMISFIFILTEIRCMQLQKRSVGIFSIRTTTTCWEVERIKTINDLENVQHAIEEEIYRMLKYISAFQACFLNDERHFMAMSFFYKTSQLTVHFYYSITTCQPWSNGLFWRQWRTSHSIQCNGCLIIKHFVSFISDW